VGTSMAAALEETSDNANQALSARFVTVMMASPRR
jgi:hypothetical protein